jgi:hypothetical protein
LAAQDGNYHNWARLGAQLRLAQIDQERSGILRAFPGLKGDRIVGAVVRPKRQMSAAARRAMSAGMKRYWARRKAAGARGGAKAS